MSLRDIGIIFLVISVCLMVSILIAAFIFEKTSDKGEETEINITFVFSMFLTFFTLFFSGIILIVRNFFAEKKIGVKNEKKMKK